MVGAGKNPIDVLNTMMDNDLAALNEKGQIMPTGKTGGFNADLGALMSGDHGDGVDPSLCKLFMSVTDGGGCPKDFMNYMLENDLLAVSEDGKPVLSEKGAQFNYDLADFGVA